MEKAMKRERRKLPVAQKEESRIYVTRTIYGIESSAEDLIAVSTYVTEPARVRVAKHLTRNLGNYESAKVSVSVEVPCYAEESEIDRAFEFASCKVDERFLVEFKDIDAGI